MSLGLAKFDPFRISVPHSALNIILTQTRRSDGEAVLQALNDPRVYVNLDGPPFPYTHEDWESWYSFTKDATETCQQEWNERMRSKTEDIEANQDEAAKTTPATGRWVGRKQWISTIREVMSPHTTSGHSTTMNNLTEPFIGQITIRRSGFPHISNSEARLEKIEWNAQLLAGDPSIVWEVGFYLTPAYHGKGIMPLVLRTLMREVMIPHMNVHTILSTYFEHNLASRRVFEKCNFQLLTFLSDAMHLAEAKLAEGDEKGKKLGIGIMQWKKIGWVGDAHYENDMDNRTLHQSQEYDRLVHTVAEARKHGELVHCNQDQVS